MRKCFEIALVAVIVLIFALCRHLGKHRSAAVEFAKALRAAIEPLMSTVVQGGSYTTGQPSISPPMLLSHANVRGHGGITFGLDHAEVDERRRANENKRHNLRGWLHAFVCPCVRVCLCGSVPRSVCVGAWVDAGLCVPMTVRSATNAIATILKFDCFSGRTADLHMFLRSWCEWLVVRVA